ncbi:MAG: hypothetical protein B7C55_09710 [Actinomycetales bacterium mxb001]|nr:MAG: hypothetical protein B7C55_09710 [Actinomycetales bacterium mxb001]
MLDDPRVVSVFDAEEAQALIAGGAVLQRHAHVMRLRVPQNSAYDEPEFLPFTADADPPLPWDDVLPGFLAAYPPDHPDHDAAGPALIDSYLIPYTRGAALGPLICRASAIAVRDGHAYGGLLIVDRPGEGPWVCDVWRDPAPDYAGTGVRLLRWAASRLDGYDTLGLVVTVGNDAALRAYERVGFTRETTAWRLRLAD